MSHHEIELLIAVLTGVFAGIISEIGGAGGLLSLPVLISMGLPPLVANATNRLGIMTLYSFAYVGFRQKHKVELRQAWPYAIPVILGAIAGALFAVTMTNQQMSVVIILVTIIMVLFTALSSELPIKKEATTDAVSKLKPVGWVLMFVVGVYSGFIEQAMAYLMFFLMVRVLNVEMELARGLKFFLSMILTPFAVIIFAIFGHIDWEIGMIVALGSAFGGWIGAWMLEKWKLRSVKRLIILSLAVSLIYLLLFTFRNYIKYGTWFI